MNEEEKKALKVINARTRRLLDELEIEKEDMSDEPKIAYLMQEIRANKIILNLVEKLQKENEEAKEKEKDYNMLKEYYKEQNEVNAKFISVQKIKDKIEELKAQYKTALEENSTEAFILKCQITILQELIEERKEK